MGLKEYSLSGFYEKINVLSSLLKVVDLAPYMFRKDVKIESVFGSFPNVIWNGARMTLDLPIPKTTMSEIIDFYNSKGIGICFTYNNSQLEKKHMGDYLANMTLELAYNKMNSVIVNNSVLEKHIKTNFPDLKLIGSCTAANWDKNWLKQRAKEVDLLVLPPEYNTDYELIKEIGVEKVRILITESCRKFCPQKRWHYDNTAKAILEFDMQKDKYGYDQCTVFKDGNLTEWGNDNPDKILHSLQIPGINKLSDIGVKHFKIPGRGGKAASLITMLYNYLITQESAADFFIAMHHSLAGVDSFLDVEYYEDK